MFSDLGLAAPLLQALEGEGYEVPTPIQMKAIPIVLAGGDLLGIAQTGTGKTAAFALPIIQRLMTERRPAMRKGCRTLVLAPTRELSTQIAQSFRTYGRHVGLSVAVVFGGVGHRLQTQALARGVDVLVATPGRLLDHIAEGNITLTAAEIFVLDEADQMLDLGFLPPIRRIVAQLSSKQQSLFFSATMPQEIDKLASELLCDPAKVAVTPVASTVDSVTQRVLHVETRNKPSLLVELLADPLMRRALVFTRTKRGADRVARHLDAAGIRVAAIHGNKSQSQRERALADFRVSRVQALVATDIAARGIDIDQVTHVVNYELPDVPESYVHRIGRTARAGAPGIAISLCDADEHGQLREIERLIRRSIPAEERRNPGGRLADGPGAHTRPNRCDDRNGWGTHGRRGQQKPAGGKRHRAPHATRHVERSMGSGRAWPAAGPRRNGQRRGQTQSGHHKHWNTVDTGRCNRCTPVDGS